MLTYTFCTGAGKWVSHHVSENDSSETIDVHVLQQSVWVFDGRKVTRDVLYDGREDERIIH